MLKLRHTGVYVHDLEVMKNFYCDTFGMEVAVHAFEKGDYISTVLGLENIELELYKLKFNDGTMIELLHRVNESENEIRRNVYNVGCFHFAITLDNVEDIYIKLNKNGINCISKPIYSADGTAKVCFCIDPEGNYIELVEEI